MSVAHVTDDFAGTASLLARCVVYGVAILIWIGIWTPLAALASASIQITVAALGYRCGLQLLVVAAASLSLAMLGPGAWSLDARLFGRKRII